MILFLFLFLFSLPVYAEEPVNAIRINEFAIEPEQTVELLNTSNEIIDISGWYIDDNGGTTFVTVPPDTFMYPHACMVIQKNFNLNKTSTDTIRLFNSTSPPTDPLSELVDFYEYSSSPGIGISFQRNPDGTESWIANPSSFEFLNESGISCLTTPTQTPTPILPTHTPIITQTITPTQMTTPQSYDNIFISEAFVAPNAGIKEWVELYNDNDFVVILSNWYIDDAENSGSLPKTISVTIDSKSYKSIEFTSAIFNNSGDDIRLLDYSEIEKDFFEYSSSKKGKSWGWTTIKGTEFCLQTPSPNAMNNACFQDQISPSPNPSISTGSNKDDFSISSQTNSSTQHGQTSSSIIYSKYVIPVSPPTLIQKSQDETNNKQVLGSSSAIDLPHQNTFDFSLLAMGYSLLSIGSLILKMIYSN